MKYEFIECYRLREKNQLAPKEKVWTYTRFEDCIRVEFDGAVLYIVASVNKDEYPEMEVFTSEESFLEKYSLKSILLSEHHIQSIKNNLQGE